MARRSPRQWLLVGVVCGLAAVVLVRGAVALLVGSVKVLAVLVALGLAWVVLRGPRDRRD